jgi:hypothetical protein
VHSNRVLLVTRTPRKEIAHAARELLDVIGIEFLPPFGSPFAGQASGFCIREALLFRPCERGFFYQYALPFVSLPRTAEPDHHCSQSRIATGASRERGIATR